MGNVMTMTTTNVTGMTLKNSNSNSHDNESIDDDVNMLSWQNCIFLMGSSQSQIFIMRHVYMRV